MPFIDVTTTAMVTISSKVSNFFTFWTIFTVIEEFTLSLSLSSPHLPGSESGDMPQLCLGRLLTRQTFNVLKNRLKTWEKHHAY